MLERAMPEHGRRESASAASLMVPKGVSWV